jgi:hypothetical protein
MPCWPLLLPPPAVSTSTSTLPSRSRGSSPSVVVESPLCYGRAFPRHHAAPSITLNLPSRRPSPLCSWSIAAALVPCLAVEEPSRRTSPSRSRRPCRLTTPATRHTPPRPLIRMVVALPLLTPPPSICRCLSLRNRLSCLSSIRLVVASPRFSRRHLPSAGASASHRAVASCPLSGLSSSWLRRHLSSRRHHISAIIESSQRSGLMLI